VEEQTDTKFAPKVVAHATTIGDALDWYGRDDGIVRSSALREVINLMIQGNVKTDFENDSYLDALVLTEVMFNRANRSIQLFTGPGCEKFLQTLQQSFVNMLERFKNSEAGGTARIIMVADKKPDFLVNLESRYRGTLEVVLARAAETIGHFFVCDAKMARVEKPHALLTEKTPINAVQAQVSFNNPIAGKMLETRFEAYWNVVKPKSVATP
jgi:hypothetical protein